MRQLDRDTLARNQLRQLRGPVREDRGAARVIISGAKRPQVFEIPLYSFDHPWLMAAARLEKALEAVAGLDAEDQVQLEAGEVAGAERLQGKALQRVALEVGFLGGQSLDDLVGMRTMTLMASGRYCWTPRRD